MRMIDSRQLIMAASIFGLAFSGFSGSTWGANTTLSTKTVTVNCDAAQPQSLQAELDKAVPGLTILVSGTCSEPDDRYIIRTNDVTIDGQGTIINIDAGEVTGGAILNGRITVRGNDVIIQNLTLVGVEEARSSGIVVNFGASATIRGSVIKDAGNHGININQGAYAQIGSGRRQHDEVGTENSQGNLIQNNDGSGISIRLGGAADVAHNVITGHSTSNGISVVMGGVADIAANFISFNRRGISVSTGGVAATDDSGHTMDADPAPEIEDIVRETNTIENNGRGINCSSAGILSAQVLPDYDLNDKDLSASDSCEVDNDLGPIT